MELVTVKMSALYIRHRPISFTVSPTSLTLAFFVSLTPLIHQTGIDFAMHKDIILVE
jgi:hypothetical protein